MPSSYPAQRLDDILENIGRIREYTNGMDLTNFIADRKTADAVERCFQRISEAALKLGDRYDADYPDLDLAALRGFGNVLRHDYDSVQPVLLWGFVRDRLEPMESMARIELEKLTRELEQKNKLLENLANIDGLTEINNHRFFQNFLDQEINRSIRNERTISILLADIDHFKKFNDTYGHQTGDFILKEFCRVCKESIREYDLIARYGGEEFIFVLPETEPGEAKIVAEKIRSEVENFTFDDGESVYKVTISIGVASARPSGRDFKKNEFIGLADEALYQAKGSGRNRVAMYSSNKKKKWFNF
ncbi:MAG: diguanylate cyclase [Desulfobulbaceae bacterium]|nr:diguanylate cyclase [Desulfobulbaceae bacterium]